MVMEWFQGAICILFKTPVLVDLPGEQIKKNKPPETERFDSPQSVYTIQGLPYDRFMS